MTFTRRLRASTETDERWPQVKAPFQAAVERPADERSAFLAPATGDDTALRREVDSLLAADTSHAGLRVGPYEIVAPLGAGAMGEVYRARDTKLNRIVALKVLPERFALDSDRLARFAREAHLLARLNHPNIGALYGLEEWSGVQALVLQLVEGPTLGARSCSTGGRTFGRSAACSTKCSRAARRSPATPSQTRSPRFVSHCPT